MKWVSTNSGWTCSFGGHKFHIFAGPYKYKLWCYDICESTHWTRRGAKAAMLEHVVEHCLYRIDEIEESKIDKEESPL